MTFRRVRTVKWPCATQLFVATAFTVAFAAPNLHAQSSSDPRFDAIASLAEAKMKEFGVP